MSHPNQPFGSEGSQSPGQPSFPPPGPPPGAAAPFSPAGAGAGSPAGTPPAGGSFAPPPTPHPPTHDSGSSGGGHDDSGAKGEAKRVASETGDRAKEVASTAKQEAASVADAAKSAGSDVLGTAKEEAGHVLGEAKEHTRQFVDTSVGELKHQAKVGQQWAAEAVRALSGELQGMTRNAEESGPVVELATRAQHIGQDAADWLENHEPEELLESVRRYAARKPWTFLAISAAVGFVGARLVRGLQSDDDTTASHTTSYGTGALPARSSGSVGYSTGAPLAAPSYSDDSSRLGQGTPTRSDSLRADEARREAGAGQEYRAQFPDDGLGRGGDLR